MFEAIKFIFTGAVAVFSLVLGFMAKRKIDEQEDTIQNLTTQNKNIEIEKENVELEKKQIKYSYKEKEKIKNAELEIEKENNKIEKQEKKDLLTQIDKIEYTKDGEVYEIKL